MAKLKVRPHETADEKKIPILAEGDDIVARIREQAYHLFAQRGFDGGNALNDWLAAERSILQPTAELRQLADGYRLRIALPGCEPDDIHVAATPGELFVSASARQVAGSKSKRSPALWSEFYTGTVYRRVALPRKIATDTVTAELKRGILEVIAPFPKAAKGTTTPKKKVARKKAAGKKGAAKNTAAKPARATGKRTRKKASKKTTKKRGKA